MEEREGMIRVICYDGWEDVWNDRPKFKWLPKDEVESWESVPMEPLEPITEESIETFMNGVREYCESQGEDFDALLQRAAKAFERAMPSCLLNRNSS